MKIINVTAEEGSGGRELGEVPTRVLVVSGEASGDAYAAVLTRALIAQAEGPIEVFGMGGSQARAAGMETVIDSETHASVMGLTEIVGSLRKISRAFHTLVQLAAKRRPDVVVLIDFPDFNLRLAKAVHKLKVPVLYFVTPQVWAWRKSRVKSIAKYTTKVAPIFPFEEHFYQQHGVDAEYVGHPFLDRPPLKLDRDAFLRALRLDPQRPIVALLPGSRVSEVERLLEPMCEAFLKLRKARPGLQAIIPVPPTLPLAWFKLRTAGIPDLALVSGMAREVLNVSRVGVVASGTATVEAALEGLPFVVVYKLSPTTYRVARWLVKGVRHFAMANLVAGKKVVEELLQEEVTGDRIAMELERILGDAKHEKLVRTRLGLVRDRLMLGKDPERTAAERAAQFALDLAMAKKRGKRSKRSTWTSSEQDAPRRANAKR